MVQTDSVASRRTTSVLAVLTCLAVGSFAISVLPGVRSGPGFVPVVDGWLQGGSYVLLAVVALRSLVGDVADRRLRAALVVALVLRAAGFVVYLGIVRRTLPPAYPSVADAIWLASSVMLVVGVSYVAWRQSPRATRTLVLDAVVAALVVAGVVSSLLYDTLVSLADPSLPSDAVVTNLAYPILDVALLIVVAGLMVAVRCRTSAAVWAMAVGAVGLSVVDCVYFYLLVQGSFGPGSPLAALSLAATALLAWACPWLSTAPRQGADEVRGLGVPAVLASAGLAMLFVDAVRGAPLVGLVLLTTGIVVAIARALLTRQQDADVASDAIEEKQLELERFKALVEASDDFIAIAGMDGRLVYLNPAGRRLVGLPEDVDVTTTTVGDFVPELASTTLGEGRPGLMDQGSWRGDSELTDHSGGSPIPVTVNTFLLRDSGTAGPRLMATVQRDISELRAAEAALRDLADERQMLLDHLVEAQEDERSRIAADVHDDSVQALASVDLQLGLLRRRLAGAEGEVLGTIDQLHQSVREASSRLRHLLFDLDSPAQRNDLRTALEEAAVALFDPSVRWRVEGEDGADLPVAQRVTAYRMAKEAMVNVSTHARATTVVMSVRLVDDGVQVEVADDGVGFDVAGLERRPGHRGLFDLRDRAAIAGGWVEVARRAEGGTRVTLWLPTSADPT